MDRSQARHRKVGSQPSITLDEMDFKHETASQESQQGIVRTVEVSMDWRQQVDGQDDCDRKKIVPRNISESER